MIKALSARSLTTVISALFGILTARMILGSAGVEYFALYALVTTLPSLLQFQDLGAGAALVNTIAHSKRPSSDPQVSATMMSVWRIMLVFSCGMVLVNCVLLATGGWSGLLGDAGALPNAPLAAFSCVAVWAIGIPLGIWQRIMLGLRKNHLSILIQGGMAPLNLVLVWLILQIGPSAQSFLALASYLAAFLISGVGAVVALRLLPEASKKSLRELWFPRRHVGVRVMDVGWPMLAQMLSAPLSITAQRYVLAQTAPTVDVAEYTAAAQVYFSMLGVIGAAGVALWPRFARQRAAGTLKTGPFHLSLIFAGACAAVSVALLLAREPLFAFTTNGKVEVHFATALAFSVMLVLQAALYPLGMFIMDKPGIRFQVVPTITMAISSLILALLITPRMGVTGPLISNSACVLCAQVIPFTLYIIRHRDRLWRRG